MNTNAQRGFSLHELLIVLIIAAIFASIAAPGFTVLMQKNRIATATSDISGALSYIRSEAIRRGQTVALCPNAAGLAAGWDVRLGNCNTSTVLSVHEPLKGITFPAANTIATPLLVNRMGIAATGAPWVNADNFVFHASSCTPGMADLQRRLAISALLEVDAKKEACPQP
ncbi:MAG: GspH/FimT family pseudopilin [Azoarcus sp.]|jgi:prepilin-type N-terminal cleavage/methylation domain-containing protein|nr:GspH/FimT family pseudopilin [Azoarcus sp.]